MRERVPLRRRRYDLVFVAFFLVNLGFITYFVDIEQLTVADPTHFAYPAWPPPWAVDLVHWYGNHFDPLLMARPPWWRMTIWIDVVYFGPFYLAAILSFLRGWDRIRVFALVWAGMMLSNVIVILGEEWAGPHATDHRLVVFAANGPWLLLPLAVIVRMRRDHPFTRALAAPAGLDAAVPLDRPAAPAGSAAGSGTGPAAGAADGGAADGGAAVAREGPPREAGA